MFVLVQRSCIAANNPPKKAIKPAGKKPILGIKKQAKNKLATKSKRRHQIPVPNPPSNDGFKKRAINEIVAVTTKIIATVCGNT